MLENIYYIGQSFAVFIILLTLGAIYIQTRQTHRIERGVAQADILKEVRNWWTVYINDEGLFDDIRYCLRSHSTASPFQQARFNAWAITILGLYEQAYYHHQDQRFDKHLYTAFEMVVLSILKMPGGSDWWRNASKIIGPHISNHLHGRLKETGNDVTPWDEVLPHMAQISPSTNVTNINISDHG